MEPLDLADRYGTRKSRMIPIAIIISVFGIGWLIWAANFHSKPEIRTDVISYNAISNNIIELKFQVTRKNPNQIYTCTLTGSDINHFVVGEIQRKIKAGERLISVQIPTRSYAAFAQVARCSR